MALIDNNEYKYWLVIDDTMPKLSKTIYYFDKDDKWLVFDIHKNSQFEKYDGGDVFLSMEWKLKNDSCLTFSSPVTGITKLKTCSNSLIPPAFRKMQ